MEVGADVCVLELDGLLREALEVGGDDPLVTVAAPAPRSRSAARQPRRWQGLGLGWGSGAGGSAPGQEVAAERVVHHDDATLALRLVGHAARERLALWGGGPRYCASAAVVVPASEA